MDPRAIEEFNRAKRQFERAYYREDENVSERVRLDRMFESVRDLFDALDFNFNPCNHDPEAP